MSKVSNLLKALDEIDIFKSIQNEMRGPQPKVAKVKPIIKKSPRNSKDINIDVSEIKPVEKDRQRAEGLAVYRGKKNNNGAPFAMAAILMAEKITDYEKMVRRAKAVVKKWGCKDYKNDDGGQENVWLPFETGLERMGFSKEDIEEIKKHK